MDGPSTAGRGEPWGPSAEPGAGLPSAGPRGNPPNPETDAVRVGWDVRVGAAVTTEVVLGVEPMGVVMAR